MRNTMRAVGAAILLLAYGAVGAHAQNQTIQQAVSDEAQRTTLAFSALGMITGNLEAQSFFPPGKVADYTGFQFLRDNDPDSMGHNTSFLSRVANNVLYILSDSQLSALKSVALGQVNQVNLYGYKRFALMKAFRRLLDGTAPAGSTGLNLITLKAASRELYLIDGQISYDRAALYADVYRSMTSTQIAYLEAMRGKGWASWPNIPDDAVRERLRGLSRDECVGVMTYAGDLFSWYAGSVYADTYFCPERHGTYFGSFYMKDAPAVGHEGYSISQTLTATAGRALCDSATGYVTPAQAALFTQLVDLQRANLYAGTTNIVGLRSEISTALRSLVSAAAPSDAFKAQVRAFVLARSAVYGDIDGENEYCYATTIGLLNQSLTAAQKAKLATLRQQILSGVYADGTPFDFTTCTTPYLYSAAISDLSLLAPYIANTDYLFTTVARPAARLAVTVQPTVGAAGDPLAPAAKVVVQDLFGVAVPTAATAITASIATGPLGGALSGAATVKAVAGVATFTDLRLSKPGIYTLRFAAAGLASAVTARVTVSAGAPTTCVFTVQPAGTRVGAPINPAVRVTLLDRMGNVATASTAAVTVAFGQNTVGGVLNGTKTVAAVAGVATLPGLSVNKAGVYTLRASATGTTAATSAPFTITVR